MASITYQKDDIFEAKTQVIVNTVNCKGVMGKGLALAFKQRYPDMFTVYQQECKTGKLRIGRPTLYKKSTPWILNFPTKDNWKANSKIEYLEQSLAYFAAHYKEAGITSIAFPKLGTQNGKLSWDEVGPLMIKYLSPLDLDVHIYISYDDTEYYPTDTRAELIAWEHFNELALSPERLQYEVQLSKPQSKKVFEKRQEGIFSSYADIHDIIGIAKTSIKRVKSYIHSQMYTPHPLPGIAQPEEKTMNKQKKSRTAPRRPKKKMSSDQSAADTPEPVPLFA